MSEEREKPVERRLEDEPPIDAPLKSLNYGKIILVSAQHLAYTPVLSHPSYHTRPITPVLSHQSYHTSPTTPVLSYQSYCTAKDGRSVVIVSSTEYVCPELPQVQADRACNGLHHQLPASSLQGELIIIIITEMSVFNVAGYLIEERR